MFNKPNNVLGVGVNYRTEIGKDILKNIEEIDFLEVYTEKFFIKEDDKVIEEIIQKIPIVLHGLDLSIGSSEKVDETYLAGLENVMKEQNFEWFSDHISLTKHGDTEVGHLMPVQFSEEIAFNIIEKVNLVSKLTKKPFLLENITYYYEIPGGSMKEHEFLSCIIENSDAGLLLDVNNLYINSVNHKYNPLDFLKKIPLERVVEIHVAGGSRKFNMIIDTHANPVWKEVWELLSYVLKRTSPNGIIIERDANLNNYQELLDEVRMAKEIWLGK